MVLGNIFPASFAFEPVELGKIVPASLLFEPVVAGGVTGTAADSDESEPVVLGVESTANTTVGAILTAPNITKAVITTKLRMLDIFIIIIDNEV